MATGRHDPGRPAGAARAADMPWISEQPVAATASANHAFVARHCRVRRLAPRHRARPRLGGRLGGRRARHAVLGSDRHDLPRHRARPPRRPPAARVGDRRQQRRVVAGVPLPPRDRQHTTDGARDRRRVRDGPRPRPARTARHRPGVVGDPEPRRAARPGTQQARAGLGAGAVREGLPRARPRRSPRCGPGCRGSSA